MKDSLYLVYGYKFWLSEKAACLISFSHSTTGKLIYNEFGDFIEDRVGQRSKTGRVGLDKYFLEIEYAPGA